MAVWRIQEGAVPVDFGTEPIHLEQYLHRYAASAKLWRDAYLVAFARAAKCHLMTFDRGFQQYESLRLSFLGA